MYQTVATWGVVLEAVMRQVSSQHQVWAEHNAQLVRIRQTTALRATPQLIQASTGSAREISLLSEVRQVRGEENYYRLHE
eukprot:1851063-Amphidinium_carterae.1